MIVEVEATLESGSESPAQGSVLLNSGGTMTAISFGNSPSVLVRNGDGIAESGSQLTSESTSVVRQSSGLVESDSESTSESIGLVKYGSGEVESTSESTSQSAILLGSRAEAIELTSVVEATGNVDSMKDNVVLVNSLVEASGMILYSGESTSKSTSKVGVSGGIIIMEESDIESRSTTESASAVLATGESTTELAITIEAEGELVADVLPVVYLKGKLDMRTDDLMLTNQNMEVFSGDSRRVVVTVEDELGKPAHLEYATIEWTIRRAGRTEFMHAVDELLYKSSRSGSIKIGTESYNQFEFNINSRETESLTGQYFHRAILTDPKGNRSTLFSGILQFM
ncbi:hypothetical protein SP15_235 [Bacillus phage SP-15]|uniref:Uncharacterized protein n=1 Tax=Bacillus phage SP-15 TaxID=1792032 RepID=A0A127AWJ8_9CAUD|nr:hypothetical protein SP15_235 [Bacillus phage SP-15]AMM45038.1 hypothetical protein SP15_235 [Bacillus phage SP-15]